MKLKERIDALNPELRETVVSGLSVEFVLKAIRTHMARHNGTIRRFEIVAACRYYYKCPSNYVQFEMTFDDCLEYLEGELKQ